MRDTGYFDIAGPKPGNNVWMHLGLTYFLTGTTFYQDGSASVLTNSAVNTAFTYSPGNGNVEGGRKFWGFDGHYSSVVLDELAAWNRVLTQTEIEDIFNM